VENPTRKVESGEDPSTIYKNSIDWTCAVGRVFMTSWLDLWNLRNTEQHTRDETNRESNLRAIVRLQMTEIYSHRYNVRPVDRDLYHYATVEDHLNQGHSLEALQGWCSDTYPAVLASVNLTARLGVQNNTGYMLRTRLHRRAMPSPRFQREPGAGRTLRRSCCLTNTLLLLFLFSSAAAVQAISTERCYRTRD